MQRKLFLVASFVLAATLAADALAGVIPNAHSPTMRRSGNVYYYGAYNAGHRASYQPAPTVSCARPVWRPFRALFNPVSPCSVAYSPCNVACSPCSPCGPGGCPPPQSAASGSPTEAGPPSSEPKTFADEEEGVPDPTEGDSGFGPTQRGRDDDATDIDAFKMPKDGEKDGEDVIIKKRSEGAPIKDPVDESIDDAKKDSGETDGATEHETRKLPYDPDPAPKPNPPETTFEEHKKESEKTDEATDDGDVKDAAGPDLPSPTALNPPLKISWQVVPVKERTAVRANFRNPRVARAAGQREIQWTSRTVESRIAKK